MNFSYEKNCVKYFVCFLLLLSRVLIPLLTRVRIAPSSARLACRTRRLSGRPWRWDRKNRGSPCHSRCDTIKVLPYSKVVCVEQRAKFYNPSLVMVISPYKWIIFKLNRRQTNIYCCKTASDNLLGSNYIFLVPCGGNICYDHLCFIVFVTLPL